MTFKRIQKEKLDLIIKIRSNFLITEENIMFKRMTEQREDEITKHGDIDSFWNIVLNNRIDIEREEFDIMIHIYIGYLKSYIQRMVFHSYFIMGKNIREIRFLFDMRGYSDTERVLKASTKKIIKMFLNDYGKKVE